ncbi:60S ribosomal protein L15, partial [Galemys pyrenaicus]
YAAGSTQVSVLHRPSHLTWLRYKAKQGLDLCAPWWLQSPVPKVQPMASLCIMMLIRWSLLEAFNLLLWGCHCGTLRGLNSYWFSEESTHKLFEVFFTDPFHKAIRRNPGTTKPLHKHREMWGLIFAGGKGP